MTERDDLPAADQPAETETAAKKPDFTNALRMQSLMLKARSDPDHILHSVFRFSDEIHEELDGPDFGPRDIM